MNTSADRGVPANGFEVVSGTATAAAQPAPTAAAMTQASRVFEVTRRLSGVVAIAVLGVAMLALALGAEGEARVPQAVAQVGRPPQTEAAPSPAPAPRSIVYRQVHPATTMIYYIFETEEQREMILYAEATAAMEGDMDLIYRNHYYELLDAGTPEGEQQARDTIYEAMLTTGSDTRIVVEDARAP